MSTIKSSSADLTLNADGSGNDIKFQSNAVEVGSLTAEGVLTIGGTTPTLTIGDAGAEDTKIVFDGNAQDYYIGLDDTDDDFKIGLGSTLGTTAHIVIDETGAVTKPLQPAFLVYQTVSQEILNAAQTTITFTTEVTDRNADYDGTSTFTAPVTGLYLFAAQVVTDAGASTDTRFSDANLYFVASNRTLRIKTGDNESSADDHISMSGSVLIDMDASDTITVDVFYSRFGSSGSTDTMASSTQTTFSGHLVC